MRMLVVTTMDDMLRDFLLPYARHFRSRGWQVDALARRDWTYDECAEAFDHVYEADWSRNPLALRAVLRNPRMIRELVEREGYEIVHTHTPIAGFITRFALRDLRRQGKVKVLYTAHGFHFYKGGSPLKNVVFLAIEKLAGRWTDFLIVINGEDERATRRYRIVSPDRLRVMPGIGMDLARYDPGTVSGEEVMRVRAELGLVPADTLFLMIAEYTPNKNHRHAVRALARLGRPDVHLALAGQGGEMDAVRCLACELGVAERVHFLGYRRDIPALVRAARAVLLVSAREGLPRCITESLSLATPVIGTNIRGTRDLLADGGGLLVPVGEIEKLAAAMTWMAKHADEAREMGVRGRTGMAKYDIHHMIALHESLYLEADEQLSPPQLHGQGRALETVAR